VRGRLLKLLAALSLLLCVAACALWVRAAGVSDRVAWATSRAEPEFALDWFSVRTLPGGLLLRWDRREYAGLRPFEMSPEVMRLRWDKGQAVPLGVLYPPATLRTHAGFAFARSRTVYGSASEVHSASRLAVPFWAIALGGVPLPAAFLLRRRLAGRRAARGLCPQCGYDLRATPERCPECGTGINLCRGLVS
jgi:hypothetical protein